MGEEGWFQILYIFLSLFEEKEVWIASEMIHTQFRPIDFLQYYCMLLHMTLLNNVLEALKKSNQESRVCCNRISFLGPFEWESNELIVTKPQAQGHFKEH